MTKLKTRPTKQSVTEFVQSIEDPGVRADVRKIGAMMRAATSNRPRMWGSSIVGYGTYSYSNTVGKNFEWMLTGYSPRKQAISVYIMDGFPRHEKLMNKLGKYKTGKSCLYIKRLADVDEAVLEQLIQASVESMRSLYSTR